ncbi:hypothetical protein ODZ84_07570 [Chryseobacterium fluminis]|uniref:hypothetical protein n=1 Tax=Chryseobacterium fluminis TaxID=2983606 RepID=UPI002258AF69|nr:hypothetical protein [Chryseobacterium sp. MMS21-Ot14]UZT99412.1 hypothetical protein ODZ84_07570 [Chryseobacterium sp. MMS21-Ot14]
MKKLWIGAVIGLSVLGSCADKKENREEYKDEHDKSPFRNDLGDSAVAHSDRNTAADTATIKTDSTKTK